jgi:uncharacterized protein
MQLAVHVRPRSATTHVGGSHLGALVVRVVEPPDRGQATEAALRALAEALAIPRSSIRLVRGATSRHKQVAIRVDGPAENVAHVAARVAKLLGA